MLLGDDLGCLLNAMSVDPTKPFPRVAEPRPEVLGDLARLVVERGALVGFAQDPDGDRLAVVDETGHVIDSDDVLTVAVDAVLGRVKGDVVVNVTTTAAVDDVARRHGRRVHRTAVGEANVVETMQQVDAAIGGEGANGGVICPAVHLCRDSYVGMALWLDRLAETGLSASALVAALPRYVRREARVPFEHGRLGQMVQTLERAFAGARTDRTDGLKLTLANGWVVVRASNTEPILRLTVEAREAAQADALLRQVVSLAR